MLEYLLNVQGGRSQTLRICTQHPSKGSKNPLLWERKTEWALKVQEASTHVSRAVLQHDSHKNPPDTLSCDASLRSKTRNHRVPGSADSRPKPEELCVWQRHGEGPYKAVLGHHYRSRRCNPNCGGSIFGTRFHTANHLFHQHHNLGLPTELLLLGGRSLAAASTFCGLFCCPWRCNSRFASDLPNRLICRLVSRIMWCPSRSQQA
mmetsp:Transcript_33836/g.78252  ORF Transcript_33836/g.78252 Transcript_33836/m.78252 type:complete len:206 (-) Transcript_33836:154-771(-)